MDNTNITGLPVSIELKTDYYQLQQIFLILVKNQV